MTFFVLSESSGSQQVNVLKTEIHFRLCINEALNLLLGP